MSIKQEVREYELEQRRQSSLGAWFGYLLGRSIMGIFRLIWVWKYAVTWTLTAVVASMVWSYGWTIILALAVAAGVWEQTRFLTPFVGDVVAMKTRRRKKRATMEGNRFLRHIGVVSESDDTIYKVSMTDNPVEARLTIDQPIPHVPSSKLIETCRSYRDAMDARRVRIKEHGHGSLDVVFCHRDPLDDAQTITEPAAFDPDKMQVTCAVDSDGEPTSVSFGDVSGMVVGGIPGSGKTAGVTSFLLPLALSDDVELTIIDGKGGDDWSAYRPAAAQFISGDENLEAIRDALNDAYEDMQDRVATNKQKLGQSNFWNVDAATRRQAGVPFKLIIIDECQGLFEQSGRDKDEKQLMGEILRSASGLVKRGRSAGVCVVFMTQKPTSDALPTAIRDNAALRLSFRLTTTQAAQAVLGVTGDEIDVPRATEIPASRKGGAVMARDTGEMAEVRFYFMPEDNQIALLEGVNKHGTVASSGAGITGEDSEGSPPIESDGSEAAQAEESSDDQVRDARKSPAQ